jgi:hypothetical protein
LEILNKQERGCSTWGFQCEKPLLKKRSQPQNLSSHGTSPTYKAKSQDAYHGYEGKKEKEDASTGEQR